MKEILTSMKNVKLELESDTEERSNSELVISTLILLWTLAKISSCYFPFKVPFFSIDLRIANAYDTEIVWQNYAFCNSVAMLMVNFGRVGWWSEVDIYIVHVLVW